MDIEKKNSLLLVDDDRSNLIVLIDILQRDYTLYTAKDGEDAIKKAEKYLPDLILLDILLPKMDGYAVFAQLQNIEKTGKIPVIFITGLSKSGSEEKGLELGAMDYITKPFNPAIVKLKVAQQIKIINLQRDLKAAVIAAEAASLSKSQFLATVSHEIRTPLNAILGITEIQMQKETLDPDMEEALSNIYSSGDLLLGIINDILDLSKIEAGRLEVLPDIYETAELINNTAMLNIVRIGSKPITFVLSVDENVPLSLVGDELRIKQILNNLLSNAFKYTNEGEVKLAIFVEQGINDGKADTTLVFRVSDTGLGMSTDQVEKLFNESYVRFNMKANRTTEGTGLGLNITHALVEAMNGEIFVESKLSHGSVFTVRLPQQIIGSGVLGKELVESLQNIGFLPISSSRKARIIFEPMPYGSVLIVDDVESNLYVAKGQLTPYRLSIDTVMSGFQAIEKIKNGAVYDIIFMDHMMPGMDGIEATQEIRKLGYTQPIVALTANAVIGQSDVFLENGFDAFISKPIDTRRLNLVLKKFVRDRYPPEVVEAAIQQKGVQTEYMAETANHPVNPQLAEIFVRDAHRSVTLLETLCNEPDICTNGNIRLYTINVHAMKSALANVGEKELSAVALRLEEAGRAKNTAIISAETPAFLGKVWEVAEKLSLPQQQSSDDIEMPEEDRAFLRENLLVIKQACEVYDRGTAKNTITELRQKIWPAEVGELLGTMFEQLLSGDFEAVLQSADKLMPK